MTGMPRKVPKDVRAGVFAHDRYQCRSCGAAEDLTVDHIVPRARGGNNYWCNLQTLCAPCNERKGDS